MSSTRKELLSFGFIREYCKNIGRDLPTDDLIRLFAEWFILIGWDKENSHEGIKIQTELEAVVNSYTVSATCIGANVIKKGHKQNWKVRLNSSKVMIGIINDKMIPPNANIDDFTNRKYKGYGLSIHYGETFHDATVSESTDFPYAQQFNFDNIDGMTKGVLLEMQLDLTQKDNKNGILRFEIHHRSLMESITEMRKDGKYTNIAFDDIDVNEQYRLAVDIGGAPGKKIILLSD